MKVTDRFIYNPTLYSSKQGAITGYPGPANSTLALKSCPGPNLYKTKKGGYKKRKRSTRKRHSKKRQSRKRHYKKVRSRRN